MSQREVILLLGSNLGDQKKNLENAISLLNKRIGAILKNSEFLFSDPVEFVSKNIFCNIAVCINTSLSPTQLLKTVKEIERDLGRVEDSSVYGEYRDRIIDIDIVKIDNITFKSNTLSIPHKKHLEERMFSKEILNSLKYIL